jgi:sec-independent protein translocase protein TatA
MPMQLAMLFGSPADWVVIFIVALVIFGPDKLPELGKQLGKAVRDFRKISDEITGATSSIRNELSSTVNSIRRDVDSDHRPFAANAAPRASSERRYDQGGYDPAASDQSADGMVRAGGLRLSTSPEADAPVGKTATEESDLKGQ